MISYAIVSKFYISRIFTCSVMVADTILSFIFFSTRCMSTKSKKCWYPLDRKSLCFEIHPHKVCLLEMSWLGWPLSLLMVSLFTVVRYDFARHEVTQLQRKRNRVMCTSVWIWQWRVAIPCNSLRDELHKWQTCRVSRGRTVAPNHWSSCRNFERQLWINTFAFILPLPYKIHDI